MESVTYSHIIMASGTFCFFDHFIEQNSKIFKFVLFFEQIRKK